MEEIWRDIPNYEGLYQVSNLGRIKSLPKIINNGRSYGKIMVSNEKIMKPRYDKDGYLRIGITKNKKQKIICVHRLVAFAFIPNPQNKKQINHINGIKDDNKLENLEWVTNSENQLHSIYKLGNKPHEFKKYKPEENPRNIPILMINKNNKVVKEFYNSIEAGKYLKEKINIKSKKPERNIRRAVTKGYSAYGYYWKNKEKENN